MKKTLLSIVSILFIISGYAQFQDQRLYLFKKTPITSEDIVFVGNSITNGGEWQEFFPSVSIKNRGISGNKSVDVLSRISDITAGNPKKLFLLIGINDLNAPETTQSNIVKIIDRVKAESPSTQLYVQSILPVNSDFTNFSHTKLGDIVAENNAAIKDICTAKNVVFIDAYSKLITNSTNKNLHIDYTNDGLHLLGNGYAKWAEVLKEYIEEDNIGIKNIHYTPIEDIPTYANQRISQFEALTGGDSDIVFFGDNFVNTPEWAELLQNKDIKCRGIGISYGTTISIKKMEEALVKIYQGYTTSKPKKFFIYAGAYDILTGLATANEIRDQMSVLVDYIKTQNKETEIYIQSILPTLKDTENTLIMSVNEEFKSLAASKEITYIDLYSDFISEGVLSPDVRMNNTKYINPSGYLKWANKVYQYIDPTIQPLPEEIPTVDIPEALLHYSTINLDGTSPYKVPDTDFEQIRSLSTGTMIASFHSNGDYSQGQMIFSISDNSKDFYYTGIKTISSGASYVLRINMTDNTRDLDYGVETSSQMFPQNTKVALKGMTGNQYQTYTYLNNTMKSRVSKPGAANYKFMHNTNSLNIGGVSTKSDAAKYPFTGTINDFLVFQEELTDEQIEHIFKYGYRMTVGIENNDFTPYSISYMPDGINVSFFDGEVIKQISIYSLDGRTISENKYSNISEIFIPKRDSELQILRITTNENSYSIKIVN